MSVIKNDTLLYTGESNPNDVRLRDGTVAGAVNATVNATGVSYVYAIGAVAVTADANEAATGVAITYAVNSASVTADANEAATGVTETYAIGTVAISGDANESATGVSYVYAVNDATVVVTGGADATVNATGVSYVYAIGAVLVQAVVAEPVRIGKRQRWLKFHKIHSAEVPAHGNSVRYGGVSTVTQVKAEVNAAPIRSVSQWAVASGAALSIRSGRCIVQAGVSVDVRGSKVVSKIGQVSPSCASLLLAHGGASKVSSSRVTVVCGAKAAFSPVSIHGAVGHASVRAVRNPSDEEMAMIIAAVRRGRAQGTRRSL